MPIRKEDLHNTASPQTTARASIAMTSQLGITETVAAELQRDKLSLAEKLNNLAATLKPDEANDANASTESASGKKPSWFKRHIDDRIEAKCKKIFERELSNLIELRKKSHPESSELEQAYFAETLKIFHHSYWQTNQPDIDINRRRGLSYTVLGVIGIALAIILGVAISGVAISSTAIGGPIGIALGGFFMAGVDFYILHRIPKNFEKELKLYIETTLKPLAESPRSIEAILAESIRRAENIVKPEATEQAKSDHKKAHTKTVRKHVKHKVSVAKQSMFANNDTPANDHVADKRAEQRAGMRI